MKKASTRTVLLPHQHGISRVQQMGHYRYSAAKPGLENHFHQNSIEICYCIDGVQQYSVGSRIHYLRGGDILIIPANQTHSTGGMPEEKGELFWIQLQLGDRHGKLCHLPQEKTNLLLKHLQNASNAPFFGGLQLKELLMELFTLVKQDAKGLDSIRKEVVLLRLLLDTLELSQRRQEKEVSERIRDIDGFIEKNLHRSIYVDELADLTQVSTGYFKAWFKINMGNTPKEYINRKRIDLAKKRLQREISVTKVAYDLGFNSSQYFSTVFRKYTGKSPKEYIQEKTKAE